MHKLIQDRCPGASDARRKYLEQRIDRVLGSYAAAIESVRLDTKRVTAEPPEQQDRFVVTIACELRGQAPVQVSFTRPTLPLALASAFEGAAYRLSMSKTRPSASPSPAR